MANQPENNIANVVDNKGDDMMPELAEEKEAEDVGERRKTSPAYCLPLSLPCDVYRLLRGWPTPPSRTLPVQRDQPSQPGGSTVSLS